MPRTSRLRAAESAARRRDRRDHQQLGDAAASRRHHGGADRRYQRLGGGGRFHYFTQSAAETPEAFIKAARPGGVDLMADCTEAPDAGDNKKPFPPMLEAFLRHGE